MIRSFIPAAVTCLILSTSALAANSPVGSKWKVGEIKFDDGPGTWSTDDVKWFKGKSVQLKADGLLVDKTTCKRTYKASTEAESKDYLADFKNPCGSGTPAKVIQQTNSDACGKARFPSNLVAVGKDTVAFGEGVFVCLKAGK